MEIEDKVSALLKKLNAVFAEDEELKVAILPTLTVAISTMLDGHLEDIDKGDRDKYLYHVRGYDHTGRLTVMTVDYDTMPYLSLLDDLGEPTWDLGEVLISIKNPEEDTPTKQLH